MRRIICTRSLDATFPQRVPNGETLPNVAQAGSMRPVHCPECGTKAKPGTAACTACGQPLPEEVANNQAVFGGRTMVGVNAPGASAPPVPAPLPEDLPTIVVPQKKSSPADPLRTKIGVADDAPRARMPSQLQNTILGGVVPPELQAAPAAEPTKKSAQGTLLGGAGSSGTPAPAKNPNAPREMPHELGATMVPQPVARPRRPNRIGAERLEPDALVINRDKLARKRIVLPPAKSRQEPPRNDAKRRRRRFVPLIAGALLFFVLVVGGAIFWRSGSTVQARVRLLPDGHDAVDVTCSNCPDGTKTSIGDSSATMTNHVARIPLVAPLALGENRLKIALDRPGREPDETSVVSVNVSYRLRPDLSTLHADKPMLHVAVEALKGTEITLDGQLVKLEDGPKAHPIDVSADCSGSSDEPATLKRQIAYSVKLPDGTRDEGAVDINVAIVALRVDAPGPRVVTESDTFVLSGHTMKGAEVLVAGRPIQVNPDGAFAQRMSVSSIGATNIDVRAKIPGMAPRIVPIAVQRVEHLDQAAKEFQKEQPVGYTTVALASKSDVGRPVIVTGQISELRMQNLQTIYTLEVPAKEGCPKSNEACKVRLVQGAVTNAKVGDSIIAYGQIGRPATTSTGDFMPEIQVAFTLPAATKASP